MEFVVTMYAGGSQFDVRVIAGSREDARRAAQAQNPGAQVVGINQVC